MIGLSFFYPKLQINTPFHCKSVNISLFYGSESMMTNPGLEKNAAASAISTPHTHPKMLFLQ